MNQAAMKKAIALEGCLHSRRRLLRQLSCLSLGLPARQLLAMASLGQQGSQHQAQQTLTHPAHTQSASTRAQFQISTEEDQFLNQLEHANFLFFWEQANPQTGLIKDRCTTRANDTSISASI